jgi:cell division protein FtsQ
MPEPTKRLSLQQVSGWAADHRRSLSGLLLLGVLAMIALWGTRWLSDPYRFPLDVVEVKGEFRYLQKPQLQAAVMPHATGGFFTVDVDRVREAAEALPWVNSAKVRRIWPATLRVQITEQLAVAGWNGNGFLNVAGESFFPQAGMAPDGLPQLAGPEGQGMKVLQQYREISRTLQPLDMHPASLAMDKRRAWTLQLENGVQLKLGRARPWTRLQRFVRAYPDVFAGRMADLKRVDMRYSNGFSVYWQRPAATGVVAQRDT